MEYKKRVTAMKVRANTYGEIMQKHGKYMDDAKYRSMLVSLKPGCFVETPDGAGGDVVEVIRDRFDIPVTIKTECNEINSETSEVIGKRYDMIDVKDIYFWEAWDFITPEYLFEDCNSLAGELMFESEVM